MSPNRPPAIYANSVAIRVTENELVFEFGLSFPDKPGQPLPADYAPDVTVVLSVVALSGLLAVLNNLQDQRRQKTQAAEATPSKGKPS